MSAAIVSDPFADEQDAVRARLEEILDACRVKDFERLAAYHLSGPKFSKYDDEGPQGRQDDRTAMQAEIDSFTPLEGFDGCFEDLKIDVFGAVAVATGIFRCTFSIGGERGAAQSRSTVVLVNDDGDWLIAHEHHSPFVEGAEPQASHERKGSETPAEVFDRLFLPAMAGPWAVRLADAARLVSGDHVLDVACGTGAVAQEAARRVRPDGKVTGLDRSSDMLAVARRKLPDLDLREGRAEALPFDDDVFDVVTCQFGLMFFDDRGGALQQMRRVLRSGGRLAVAVWDRLERTPGYAALTELVERHLGTEAGEPVRAAFALGDVDLVRSMLQKAGVTSVEARSVDASARFPSVDVWVEAEVRGWIGGDFGEQEYGALLADAHQVLAPYEKPDGSVEFALPAIIATGSKD